MLQYQWPEWTQKKLILPDEIEKRAKAIRQEGKSIVTLNGSFDLMHAGHLYILFEAAKAADVLIVALNSDASIQTYKSTDRPIIPLQQRLEMVSAIECVDYVTWFNETDPRQILTKIRPNFHANGAEYGADCVEAEIVKQHGGKIYLIDRIPGLSTSEIIAKVTTCG